MDNEILLRLYRKYHKELYLYLYALCKNREVAEDIMQETFLKAMLALPNSHTNMRAWLYMVARNLYFNYAKHEKKVSTCEVMCEGQVENEEQDEDIAQGLIEREQIRYLYQALQKLDKTKREVLVMQYFGELSQKEIAAILHITPENVRVLAYRAKRELKKYLEEE